MLSDFGKFIRFSLWDHALYRSSPDFIERTLVKVAWFLSCSDWGANSGNSSKIEGIMHWLELWKDWWSCCSVRCVAWIDCYLFDGKYHRLYRYLISFLSGCESALAERWHFCQFTLAELWHFCQFALAERLISSKIVLFHWSLPSSTKLPSPALTRPFVVEHIENMVWLLLTKQVFLCDFSSARIPTVRQCYHFSSARISNATG